jgi:hypothetical protein
MRRLFSATLLTGLLTVASIGTVTAADQGDPSILQKIKSDVRLLSVVDDQLDRLGGQPPDDRLVGRIGALTTIVSEVGDRLERINARGEQPPDDQVESVVDELQRIIVLCNRIASTSPSGSDLAATAAAVGDLAEAMIAALEGGGAST